MTREEFYQKVLEDFNIALTEEQKNAFETYANFLLSYNTKVNITAIKTKEEVYLKHFFDSLTVLKYVNMSNIKSVLDVGSGGGFPGIVLKILYPSISFTLLDSNHKKCDFQKEVIKLLKLNRIASINERAENYYKTNIKFDMVVARAVAPLNVLSELCIPFLNNNGHFISMKTNNESELNLATDAITILGGKINNKYEFELPNEGGNRVIYDIIKIKETPEGYPRVYDKIIKKPLKIKRK